MMMKYKKYSLDMMTKAMIMKYLRYSVLYITFCLLVLTRPHEAFSNTNNNNHNSRIRHNHIIQQNMGISRYHQSNRNRILTSPCFDHSTLSFQSLLPSTSLSSSLRMSVVTKDDIPVDGTTSSSINNNINNNIPIENVDIVVCGSGPAGLLTTIMLAQKYGNTRTIRVIDRLINQPYPSNDDSIWYGSNNIAKYYLIGLGSRGQSTLQYFHVLNDVLRCCVPVLGRKDWSPGVAEPTERILDSKRTTTQILPRDKLVSVLYEHIQTNYIQTNKANIVFMYGYDVQPIDFFYQNSKSVLIEVTKCYKKNTNDDDDNDIVCDVADGSNPILISTPLLIGADGTIRSIANAIELDDKKQHMKKNIIQKMIGQRPFYVKRYIDDNRRLYKTIPLKLPSNWRSDLNYSVRTKKENNISINFDALPANNKGDYCGILLIQFSNEDGSISNDENGVVLSSIELRQLLQDKLPQFNDLIDDTTLEAIANKPISQLPSFRYVEPRLYHGNNCVLLGDCIHTVKPYFGLGANSALEDVKILSESIDHIESLRHGSNQNENTKSKEGVTNDDKSSNNIAQIIREFSKRRAKDSKILVRISRELDRPGTIGFITFILPIILDSIFTSIIPTKWFMSPNVITMLQREDLTFQQVAIIKRRDRLLQVSILASTIFASYIGMKNLFSFILKQYMLHKQNQYARIGLLLTMSTTIVTLVCNNLLSSKNKDNKNVDTTNKQSNDAVIMKNSQQSFMKPFRFRKR